MGLRAGDLTRKFPTALLRRTVPTRQTSSASYLVATRPCCRDLLIYCDSAGAEIIAADVRRFGHVINKDGVLGTHGAYLMTCRKSGYDAFQGQMPKKKL
jgi:hypothetical protein